MRSMRLHRLARTKRWRCTAIGLALLAVAVSVGPARSASAQGQTRLRNICRVKGQEENSLTGLGLVVGLNGTGDGPEFAPTIRSLAMTLQLLKNPLGPAGVAELENAKNVALVTVTATVPSTGARQGSKIDCAVASIGSASDLTGGRLYMTPMLGPQIGNPRVYAIAEGPIHVDSAQTPTVGRVHAGCRLEEDFYSVFTDDGRITLVLEENHASFQVAQDVADLANSQLGIYNEGQRLARALDQSNIVVDIPRQYREEPVSFIAQVLSLPMITPQVDARVVVNERTGSVIIGGDVTIGSAVITHRNLVIDTAAPRPSSEFVSLDSSGEQLTSLKALVEALSAIKLPADDVIEIIKGLERNGKLHGELIIE